MLQLEPLELLVQMVHQVHLEHPVHVVHQENLGTLVRPWSTLQQMKQLQQCGTPRTLWNTWYKRNILEPMVHLVHLEQL